MEHIGVNVSERAGGSASKPIYADRAFLFALMFCILIYGPFGGVLFTISGTFAPELPIIICGTALYLSSSGVQRRRYNAALIKSSPVLYLVLVFGVVGLIRGTSFADVYSDFRAIAALVICYALISSSEDNAAFRFILLASSISLVLYAGAIFLGFGEVIFSKSTFDLGKITIPIFSFSFVVLYFSGRNRLVFAGLVICLVIVVGASSLRYMFALLLYLCAVGGNFAVFGFRNKLWRGASLVSLLVLGTVAAALYMNLDLVQFLTWAQLVARDIGFGEQAIHQVLVKTTQNLTTGLNYGDLMYISFLNSIFDVERFIFPRGIGHEASIGDPAIFGGNTIDNSMIYINYHFSIFGAFFFLFVVGLFFIRLFRSQGLSGMLVLALFALPIMFVFYMRAIAFVSVSEAISFALAIRGLQLLANELRSSPGRDVSFQS